MKSKPSPVDRRQFLATSAAALAGTGMASARKAPALGRTENLVVDFAASLKDKQKELIWRPFNDKLRDRLENNWMITKARVGREFDADQQEMLRQIFIGLHSEEHQVRAMEQFQHDNGGKGIEKGSVALFGEPKEGKFELVLTGRHCTRRCEVDPDAKTAFGGPIFYGHEAGNFHEEPDHPGNVYWYQAKRANKVYQMLDKEQKAEALINVDRPERGIQTIELGRKEAAKYAGISVGDLNADQKTVFREVLGDVLAPFRESDRKTALGMIEKGGLDSLNLSFSKNQDIGKDGVWDVWQIESPSMIWYFRGSPHVHCWVHVREPEPKG